MGSVAAETFHEYVERRRQAMVRQSRHQNGWGLLLGALALDLGLCYGLGMYPDWAEFGLAWLLTTLPLTLVAIALYVLGTYVLTGIRQRARRPGQWWQQQSRLARSQPLIWCRFLSQSISLPHLVMAGFVWLGLAFWGEMLAPLLVRQWPQVVAGILVSLAVASGHYWSSGQVAWIVEAQQLWSDYLEELRHSLLMPHYQCLEVSRHRLKHYGQVYDDLKLEEVEAYYWEFHLEAQMQKLNQDQALRSYAQQIHYSSQRLSQLLYQLQEGIDLLESVLLDIETELDTEGSLSGLWGELNLLEGNLDRLREVDLHPVVRLSLDLQQVEQVVQGLTQEMHLLLRQTQPLGEGLPVGLGDPHPPRDPFWWPRFWLKQA
ncbi:MAG: hypothetical protein NW237_12655 [Cyanobacteriota bacterium]|nr:hypothetical protein [Cyanobacteriota bacterium]